MCGGVQLKERCSFPAENFSGQGSSKLCMKSNEEEQRACHRLKLIRVQLPLSCLTMKMSHAH